MAGYTDRPSLSAVQGTSARQAPRARAAGSLRDRLAALRKEPPRTAASADGRGSRRNEDETIRSLGEWIDEINRQPAVYDTGARITTPEVWPPAPDGSPHDGIAPWKLARRRELASRYGPLLAVAVLAALYFGYDAVIKRNGAMTQDAAHATASPSKKAPLAAQRAPHSGTDPARPAFRLAVAPLAAGRPSPVNVTASGSSVSGDAVFAFSGLPAGASLSAGSFADGHWAVAPRELAGLTLTPPAAYQGEISFRVALMRGGAELHSETFRLPVAGAGTQSRSASTGSPRVVTGENTLLAKGKAMMDANDIAGARLVYQHLAIQGSAAGALALARSYDPAALTKVSIGGEAANTAKAAHWYERAAEYGSGEAQSALLRLRAAPR